MVDFKNLTSSELVLKPLGVKFNANETRSYDEFTDIDLIEKNKDYIDSLVTAGTIALYKGGTTTPLNTDELNDFLSNTIPNGSDIKFYEMTLDEIRAYTEPTSDNRELIYVTELGKILHWNAVTLEWNCITTGETIDECLNLGPAGLFVTDLANAGNGFDHWTGDVDRSLNNSTPGTWALRTGTTPSSNTGPSSAGNGSYYVYTEVSSGANANTITMETWYFANLTNIAFLYNMNGVDMGTLDLDYYDGQTWSNLWTISGNQGNTWKEVTLDNLEPLTIRKVRFQHYGATGYRGDAALDNIRITSI